MSGVVPRFFWSIQMLAPDGVLVILRAPVVAVMVVSIAPQGLSSDGTTGAATGLLFLFLFFFFDVLMGYFWKLNIELYDVELSRAILGSGFGLWF